MRSQKLRLFVVGAVLFALSWLIYWMAYVSNKPTSQEKALQYSNLAFKLSQLKDQDQKSKKQQALHKEQERIDKERKIQLAEKFDRIKVNREYGKKLDDTIKQKASGNLNARKSPDHRGPANIGPAGVIKQLPPNKAEQAGTLNVERQQIENEYYTLIHSGTGSKVHGSVYQKVKSMPSDVPAENYILQAKQLPVNKHFYPSIGNGNLGTVIHSDKVFMNGVYSGLESESHRAVIPSTCAVNITATVPPTKFVRTYSLNVGSGMYTEESRGQQYKITQRIYAHRKLSNLLIVEVDLVRMSLIPLNLSVSLNRWTVSEDITFLKPESDLDSVSYKYGRIGSPETKKSGYTEVHIYYDHVPNELIPPANSLKVKWIFLTSIGISKKEAKEAYLKGIEMLRDQDNLFTTHVNSWAELWSKGAIHIKGNRALAQNTYASQYYLLSSIPWKQRLSLPFSGVSPTGITAGEFEKNYQGHISWDQEIWMFPPLLTFYPNIAEILLSSRKRASAEARKNAEKNKYKGMQYPSEAGFTGIELAKSDTSPQYKKHISGGISWAILQYMYATNNTVFLRQNGYSGILTGIADFWVSQLTSQNKEIIKGYQILNSIPPNTAAGLVDNAAYTNTLAKISLEAIEKVTERYGSGNDRYREYAQKVYIPFNQKLGYHPEHDKSRGGQAIQQADTILLGYPLNMQMPSSVRQKDLEIYEKVMQKDSPPMSWSMFSVGYLDIGNREKGNEYFKKNFQYINGNFKVWSEYPSGKGAVNLLSAMAGFLQNIIAGYGGFRLFPNKLDFNLSLPPQATEVMFKDIDYLGCSLDFRLDSDKHFTVELTRTATDVPRLMIFIYHSQAKHALDLNTKVKLPLANGAVYSDKTRIPLEK